MLLIILNLIEIEAKQVLMRYGIPIPKGILITDSKQTLPALSNLKPPYMVKAQVPVNGRGKAGGIIPANSIPEAQDAVTRLLGTEIKSFPVKQVLIEEKLAAKKELYLGCTVDRFNRCYVMLASKMGGIDVEELAEKNPQVIVRTPVDIQSGFHSFNAFLICSLVRNINDSCAHFIHGSSWRILRVSGQYGNPELWTPIIPDSWFL